MYNLHIKMKAWILLDIGLLSNLDVDFLPLHPLPKGDSGWARALLNL